MPFDHAGFEIPIKLAPRKQQQLDVLRRTRDAIVTIGWCQRVFDDESGNRCVIGWLRYYSTNARAETIAKNYLYPLIPKDMSADATMVALRSQQTAVMVYNDTATRDDVIGLLDTAIQSLQT